MANLQEQTKVMVEDTKDLMNNMIGTMFDMGEFDIFSINDDMDESTKAMYSMMKKSIAMMNSACDLSISYSKEMDKMSNQMDEMNKKLDLLLAK